MREDINSMISAIKVQNKTPRVVEHETKLKSTQLIQVSDFKLLWMNSLMETKLKETSINEVEEKETKQVWPEVTHCANIIES